MATYQGAVSKVSATNPHRGWSRFQASGAGQPHHQARPPAAVRKISPIGPLVKNARLRRTQNTAATARDGLRASSHRQNWQPTSQNVSVASVVASFDSPNMIGVTAAIKPARSPAVVPACAGPGPRPGRTCPSRPGPRPAATRRENRPPAWWRAPSTSRSRSACDTLARRCTWGSTSSPARRISRTATA